jgi:ribosome-binding protein aMBF1 (putative translation factor)
MTDSVADTVRQRRVQLGISRERVAARLKPPVTAKTIERWEKGDSPLPGWRRIQLEELYAVLEGMAA